MEISQVAVFLMLTSSNVLNSDVRACSQDDFEEQARRLVHKVSSTKDQLASLPGLLLAVKDTLNHVWPGSKTRLFGSLATGIGSSSSDADISVELPDHALSIDKNTLNRAKGAFESLPELYHDIAIRGRLPSITFYFIPAKMFCDVNFRNQATPFESDLLRYLLHADERVLKLAIILKHWAKLHKVVAKKYLTSYGMMMLLVFFLQQRSILPSVVELQKNVKAHILDGSDHYNVAFEKKKIMIKNSESLYQLLGEFFEYYEGFDFDKNIVCPFTGNPVQRSVFRNFEAVPDTFHLYKSNVASNITHPLNMTAVCIQSVLVHSDNCAWRVESSMRFQRNFQKAAKLYRNSDMCSFLNTIL